MKNITLFFALFVISNVNAQLKEYYITHYNQITYDSFLEEESDWSNDITLNDSKGFITNKKMKLEFNEFDVINEGETYQKKAKKVCTLELKIVDTLEFTNNVVFHYKLEGVMKTVPENAVINYNDEFTKSETKIIVGRVWGFKTPFTNFSSQDLTGCNDLFFYIEYPDKTYKKFLYHFNKSSLEDIERKKIEDDIKKRENEEQKALAEQKKQEELIKKQQRDAETVKIIGDGVNTLLNTLKKD